MDETVTKQKFQQFLLTFDRDKERSTWIAHQKTFRLFWERKIVPTKQASLLSETADYDPIIKMIDVKARGFNKQADIAVAAVGLTQGMWYRIFNELVEKQNIKSILDNIFRTTATPDLVKKVDHLHEANESNRNGLTGKSANALNALLVLNDPSRFVSWVSVAHRFLILEKFGLSNRDAYRSYGDRVIRTSDDIIAGFQTKYGLEGSPREISKFLNWPPIKQYWQEGAEPEGSLPESLQEEPRSGSSQESEFVIERHLEDFLVANWESTDLGRRYNLIEEDGELVSQQYRTAIGLIDLLVRDKKDGSYVVIELKKGQTSDDTAGQLLRYMGWVRQNKAGDADVRGVIIANRFDDRLRYALSEIRNAEILVYKLSFSLAPPQNPKPKK